VPFATEPNHGDEFWPYLRDPETLARPWAIPGTPGLMHRIGGIEKEDGTGNISYQPENHDKMTRLRAAKVAGIANDIPLTEVDHDDGAELLVVGWGSTWGAIKAAVRRVRARERKIAHAHLMHVHPFPADLGEVLHRYRTVLVPELNLGQLARMLRAEYLVDAQSITKVAGVPFRAADLEAAILEAMER
jgi:2-oxoglutarate ferredoxin oxidoreductase subunit alpha